MSPLKNKEPQMNADEGAPSHASGGRVYVLLRNTWARSREPAGFRHDERRLNVTAQSPQSTQRAQSIAMTFAALALFVVKFMHHLNTALDITIDGGL